MTKKTTNLIVVISIMVVLIIGIVLAVVLSSNGKEYVLEQDGFTMVRRGNDVAITGYTGTADEIEIPKTVDGFTINAIDKDAFKDNDIIKKVVIDDNIKVIGEGAFSLTNNLESIVMKGVERIENDAFNGAKRLTFINIPTSLVSIGDRAFKDATNLSKFDYEFNDKYVVQSKLSHIGKDAFSGAAMSTMLIPSSMKKVEEGAFRGARVSQFIFYEGVEEIEKEAFKNAFTSSTRIYTFDESKTTTSVTDDLEMVRILSNMDTFPSTLKVIGESAFMADIDNTTLRFSSLKMPANVTDIHAYAFSGTSIQDLSFLNPDINLGSYAFSNIDSYMKLALPANIKKINEGLFLGTYLQSGEVLIPASVEEIGIGAFSGGSTVTTLKFVEGSVADSKYKFEISTDFRGLLSKDGKTLYAVMMYETANRFVLPTSVATIEKYAFTNASKGYTGTDTASLVIPVSVNEIKAGAFSDSGINNFYIEHGEKNSLNMSAHAFDRINETKEEYTVRVKSTSPYVDSLTELFKDVSYVHVNTYKEA